MLLKPIQMMVETQLFRTRQQESSQIPMLKAL